MQNLPTGWTPNDLQRFNAVLDAVTALQAFDYVRKLIPAWTNNAFVNARQADVQNLTIALGQQFQQEFGKD